MGNDLIINASKLIGKDFGLELKEDIGNEQSLLEWLRPHIRFLLDKDFGRLLQICYRIDIGENLLKSILHESMPERVAEDLCLAIIERQKLKIELRRRFSS
ncbi:hypothetical protein ACFOUP_16680 [Belliella kenyensis]|uniref:Uncharacterized protein n=1 Tax=Belliella kenyensis TaxID=1472724 RepID=A0ABV8ESP8_9BACT|nr:hypothetical protein [Belliella kenyensis]MCH7402915.1 hypothetical protein [Belliella kenyensis]MDN3602621.1 hypothetical protein [Belliella kenyensis]